MMFKIYLDNIGNPLQGLHFPKAFFKVDHRYDYDL